MRSRKLTHSSEEYVIQEQSEKHNAEDEFTGLLQLVTQLRDVQSSRVPQICQILLYLVHSRILQDSETRNR